MCGIWGFIGKTDQDFPDIRSVVEDLFYFSESRGKEASGISGLSNQTITVLKKPEPATSLVRDPEFEGYLKSALDYGRDNFALIGHSRLATNGSEVNNENNQPVVTGDISLVHNGIIVNCDQLWNDRPELGRQSELDTEILGKIISEKIRSGQDEREAVKQSFDLIQGTASVLFLSKAGNKLVAVTNNGSLYYLRSVDWNWVIFASEKYIICEMMRRNKLVSQLFSGGRIIHIKANYGLSIDVDDRRRERFWLNDYHVKKLPIHRARTGYIEKYRGLEIDTDAIKQLRRCTKCILPETFPYIEFDSEGVCNYCRSYKKRNYIGEKEVHKWADSIKRKHANDEYDSIVSFSGGRDSSYGLHYFVKELGLKPVAYNYDWGMVTDLARRNQARMCAALGIELITVSADIHRKRNNIRKNICAWMKKPDIGMVPLFMAGDKAYFYYANVMKKRFNIDSILLASNPFETTYFKSAFCGIKPGVLELKDDLSIERLYPTDVLKMVGHYANQFITNRKYINSSLIDTAIATMSYYVIPHDYFRLFDYIPWKESIVNDVLINGYDWELANDTASTWRIGDGTAPFYNYIYYRNCGFTENDTLRSNQIREGHLDRESALGLVFRDNLPRWESLEWYFEILGLDMRDVLNAVDGMPRRY